MSIASLLDRPIAFQRAYVRLGLGVTGALMLSQAVYWSKRTKDSYGWFYKDQREWEEETGLTRREQETARKRLCNAGFLLEERRGVPCRLYYKVDYDAIDMALLSIVETSHSSLHESANLDCTKAPCRLGENRHSSTEITQETTTEITTDIIADAKSDDFEESFGLFWSAGMRKVDRSKSVTAFKRAAKREGKSFPEFAEMLVADIRRRIASCQFGFDRLHPTTYLNGARWNDEVVTEQDKQPVAYRSSRPTASHTNLKQPDPSKWIADPDDPSGFTSLI